MPTPSQETWCAEQGLAVTPSDTVNHDAPCRAYFVGTGGNVAIIGLNNTTAVTYKNVPSGSILPVQGVRVNATSTTATDIVALY